MTEKVYTPEVIVDVGFPQSVEGVTSSVTQGGSSGVSTPKVTQPGAFPKKMVAKELLSTVFNTVSKKILGAFEFAKSGAIQIGEYIAGVSGDIRISPAGIVARNKAGATTFALDGETGDGTFQGTIRASKFESDYFQVDEQGNVTASSFKNVSASALDSGLVSSFVISSNDRVDVTGASITTTFEFPTIVLLTFYMSGYFTPSGGVDTNCYIDITIQDGDTGVCENVMEATYYVASGVSRGAIDKAQPFTLTEIIYCTAGSHTFKITADKAVTTGSATFTLKNGKLSYVTLGNW
jgi:hypothetical protein